MILQKEINHNIQHSKPKVKRLKKSPKLTIINFNIQNQFYFLKIKNYHLTFLNFSILKKSTIARDV
jgi:hypothetical protein